MNKKSSKSIPKYCLHKATGQGYVTLNGKRYYLGQYEHPASKQKYFQKVAEWENNGRNPIPLPQEFTILDLIARYWDWAQTYYRKADGSPTSQLERVKRVLRPLKEMYGYTLVSEFAPGLTPLMVPVVKLV